MTNQNAEISRNPKADETEEQRVANYHERADMPADAADMQAAAKEALTSGSHIGSVSEDRARRAGVEPRLAVIGEYDLADWKQGIEAVVAVGFGPLTDLHRTQLCGLYQELYASRDLEEAQRLMRCYLLSRGLDYATEKVVGTLWYMLNPSQEEYREDGLKRIAQLAAFIVSNEEFGLHGGYHYKNQPECNPSDAILADGQAKFGPEIQELLIDWQGMANQQGQDVSLPEVLNRETILGWAHEVIVASREAEEGNRPYANIDQEDGNVLLSWKGTWTANRWTKLEISFKEDNSVDGATLTWSSGTGQPSRFLSMERLLTSPHCREYGVWEEEPALS